MRLLFITSTRIGDAVLSTGVLAHLLEAHPGIRVTVAAGDVAAPLFRAVPNLERIIQIKKRSGSLHWLELWVKVLGRRWDIIVDLRKSAIAYFLLARRRVVPGLRITGLHRVEELARFLDLDDVPTPRIWLDSLHRQTADRLVAAKTPILALGPAANWPGKQWRPERFAELARRLTRRDGALAGGSIAVFAAPHERPRAKAVMDLLPQESVIDLSDTGDLLAVAACLRKCHLYVGCDSGLMHLAASVGVPTLGLFGPTDPERYRPWGARCGFVRTPQSIAELFGRLERDPAAMDGLMDGVTVAAAEDAAHALVEQSSDA